MGTLARREAQVLRGPVSAAGLSPDGARIVSGSVDDRVRGWFIGEDDVALFAHACPRLPRDLSVAAGSISTRKPALEAVVVVAAIVLLPLFWWWLAGGSEGAREGLAVAFAALLLWVLAGAEQWRKAEDALWAAMGVSLHPDVAKPKQIHFEQTPPAIVLTAKAYVASTYNEPLLESDVTRAFLEAADELKLPLARPALGTATN